jgi:hypothetical protein
MSSRNSKVFPGAKLDSRDAQRVPFYFPVLYTSENEARRCQKKGQLIDLSKTGCRILGPVLPVGCTTTIVVDLKDGKPPLSIVGATVCWNDGYSFGVRFPSMPVDDRHGLQALVLKFATSKGTSQAHTAFRLA